MQEGSECRSDKQVVWRLQLRNTRRTTEHIATSLSLKDRHISQIRVGQIHILYHEEYNLPRDVR